MLRDLTCPKCGAPITLESAEQRIVVCSFCNATSMVEADAQSAPQLKLQTAAKDSTKSSTAPAVEGTSLWKDAWRRLLKNKIAVFGMIVLAVMVVLVSIGPIILRMVTGITADYIPANGDLIKSFPPSLAHPMG